MHIDLEFPFKLIRAQQLDNKLFKLNVRDNSRVVLWAKSLSLASGKLIRKCETLNICSSLGVLFITKMRTETILFVNQLIHLLLLPSRFHNRCACCDQQIIEDTKHFILDCPTFTDIGINSHLGLLASLGLR